MNKPAIVLGAAAVGLGVALVTSRQRAAADLDASLQATTTVSNQLSEVQLKLDHQERMNGVLKTHVQERDAVLTVWSNKLARVRTELAEASAAKSAAEAEIASGIERAQTLSLERDNYSNRIQELNAALADQERHLTGANQRAFEVETNLAELTHKIGDLELANGRLESQLADVRFLKGKLRSLETQAVLAKASESRSNLDYRLPVQLKPDGSVVLVRPTADANASSDSQKPE